MRQWVSTAICLVLSLAWAFSVAAPAPPDWPQWGGPGRNFTVAGPGLAVRWPEGGPKKAWSRTLGDGYSAIVSDGEKLFTIFRDRAVQETEYVVALDCRTGRTIWQTASPSSRRPAEDDESWGGCGPNSTPLLAGGRLFTAGSLAVLRCLDKQTGKVVWQHDFITEFGAKKEPSVGYCCSPIAYQDMVIAVIGRSSNGGSLAAFEQVSGKQRWRSQEFDRGFSSPILIRFGGRDILVLTNSRGLFGIDPANGEKIWQHPVAGSIITPVWNGRDQIFYSSGGDEAVGIAVQLREDAGRISVAECWKNKQVNIWQPTPVILGNCLVGATRKQLLGVDLSSGKILWSNDGFPMAATVAAGEKLILLDEDGRLTLASAGAAGLTIHSQCKPLVKYAYTVPTLVGSILYLRDRWTLLALELGKG